MPTWGLAMAGLTIAAAIGIATQLLPSILLVIPFIASTTARRFSVIPTEATIDHEGLWLGDTLAAPRAEILDTWADPDDTDRRVSVAVKPDELIVVHLPNAGQARRFAQALRPETADHVFAGVRPRAIDALFPLRLLAVVTALLVDIGLKSPVLGVMFVFVVIGAYGFVIATQIEAGPDGLVLRKFARERRVAWNDVTEKMLEKIPKRVVRSPLMTTSPWTKNAHARVIAHAKAEMKKRRDG